MAQANLSINANLNIQQVLNSIKQIKGNLNGLSLPKNLDKQFSSAASKLEKSLNELSLFSGKELSIDEAKQALKIIEDIQKAGVNFQGVLKNIGGLDLKNLKLDSFTKSYDDITNAVKRYGQAVENVKKSTTNAYAKAQTEQKNLKSQITAAQSSLNDKTVKRDVALLDLEAEKQKLEEAKRIAEEYKKTVSEEVYNKSDQKANVDATEKRVTTLQKRATDINTTIDNLKKAIADYEKQIAQLESTKKRSISATPAVQNAWNEIINLLKGSNAPGVDKIAKYEHELRHYLIDKLKELDFIELYNKDNDGVIVSFNIKGVFSQDTAVYLDKYNIAVRAGNHCAKMLGNLFHINNTCRISLSFYNTKEEVDLLINVLKNSANIWKEIL